MDDEARLADLLLRWEEAKTKGEDVRTADLCADRPDLVPALESRIQALVAMDAFLLTGRTVTSGGGAVEAAAPSLPSSAAALHTFVPLRFHARGGLGEVFVARDESLGREVALKRLRPTRLSDDEAARRFLLEAGVTARLEHPGVVPVYGFGRDADGSPFYAMKFVRGETLAEAIEAVHAGGSKDLLLGQQGLAFRRLLGAFVAVCNTIAYAHDLGILHRDLKPANIMLGPYGETLVLDWGLARDMRAAEKAPPAAAAGGGSGSTRLGSVMGTPAFMSPEQALGKWDEVGPAADVYALGATLAMIVTGRPPFSGGTVDLVIEKVTRGDFPPPRALVRSVPPALEAICLRAMAVSPEDRYATAADLARDVERWLAGEPVAAYREPLALRIRRTLRRHRVVATALAMTLLGAGVVAAVSAFHMRSLNASLRAERDRAEANLDRVRAAVRDCFAVALRDDLFRERGTRAARYALLEAALRSSREFVERRGADPAFTAELADAHVLMARTLMTFARVPEAERDLDQARALYERLRRERADSSGAAQGLARVEDQRGLVLRRKDRFEEALRAHERAARAFDALDAGTKASNVTRLHRAEARFHAGETLALLGRNREALASFDAAEAVLRDGDGASAATPEFRELQASLDSARSDASGAVGDRAASAVALGKAAAILEGLVGEFPRVDEYVGALAVVETSAATQALLARDFDAAARNSERAAAHIGDMVRGSPEGEHQRSKLVIQHRLTGQIHVRRNDASAAVRAFEAALAAGLEGRPPRAAASALAEARLLAGCLGDLAAAAPQASAETRDDLRSRSIDRIFHLLKTALAGQALTREALARDPAFASIHDDDGFQDLLERPSTRPESR